MTGLLADLDARHLIAQTSDRDELEDHLASGSRGLYCGFDPTAASLHVGNLLQLLLLRRFQRAGHRPIALVGGATGLIGDPSFRSDERALNDYDTVAAWGERLREQVSRFLDFEGHCAARLANNFDWTKDLGVIEFLRDVGKHFSVNAMIARDAVNARLERDGAGITYTEFSYMLLQAYDFLELARHHDCTIQIGGADQWGNIASGMSLVRRVLGKSAHAVTTPLITKSDGSKFGKTADGTVWLDPELTSPYAFYQYWLNVADEDVVAFLGYFTFLDAADIENLAASTREHPEQREGQRSLAREVARIVHGEGALASAEHISRVLFGGDVRDLSEDDLKQLELDGMASTSVEEGEGLLNAMSAAGLANSNGQARQLVKSKSVRANGALVEDASMKVRRQDALYGRYFLIRRGKKQWHMVLVKS